jgi:hypothetical protein
MSRQTGKVGRVILVQMWGRHLANFWLKPRFHLLCWLNLDARRLQAFLACRDSPSNHTQPNVCSEAKLAKRRVSMSNIDRPAHTAQFFFFFRRFGGSHILLATLHWIFLWAFVVWMASLIFLSAFASSASFGGWCGWPHSIAKKLLRGRPFGPSSIFAAHRVLHSVSAYHVFINYIVYEIAEHRCANHLTALAPVNDDAKISNTAQHTHRYKSPGKQRKTINIDPKWLKAVQNWVLSGGNQHITYFVFSQATI